MYVASLFHVLPWQASQEEIRITPAISLCSLKESAVEDLYHRLCYELGLDDGEPFEYTAYAAFGPSEPKHSFFDFGDPYSRVDQFCNAIALVLSQPLPMIRVIWSDDAFSTSLGTQLITSYGIQTDMLMKESSAINDSAIHRLRQIWLQIEELWQSEKALGRLTNALTYFYYAWRSHYLDQTCVNLSVTLEALFAPHAHSETTHQISFFLSRFMGGSDDERRRLYKLTKEFYAIRSRVLHGGIAKETDLIERTVEMFHLLSTILCRILSDREIALAFSSNDSRKELFDRYLFE